ncbi:immunity protein Tsi6 family protein [Novosphingobium fluoreni]|uniref:immunity protein Tsi6 family protein n=1 Tax=Novosphingobium fluoreni TaxID=1391222 RepID=UPI003DA06EBA
MTSREALFDQSEKAIAELEQEWPTLPYLSSFREQVAYLRAVERGEETDRTRLIEINIGVITAMDIEDRDADVAVILHELASVAHTMATEMRTVA